MTAHFSVNGLVRIRAPDHFQKKKVIGVNSPNQFILKEKK